MARSFSVLTYNIHKGFSPTNRRFVLHDIRDALKEQNADLVLLQEILGEHRRHASNIGDWPLISQEQFLASELWPYSVYGKNAIYNQGHHGNALLSKYHIVEWENINVAWMKSHSRSLLHAIIEIEGLRTPLHAICVHLGLFARERKRQYEKLVSRLHSHVPDSAPLIIAGDFNDWPGRATRYLHKELGVEEVFHQSHGRFARSFPARRPLLTMDRIYYRGLRIKSCEALVAQPWRHLSDHIPLLAYFYTD